MKHIYAAETENVKVRPLEDKDIEYLRCWRNNPDNTKFLRRIPYISEEQQKKWFLNYLTDPDELIFAIEETEELQRMVGSASLYNFSDESVEFGRFLIGDVQAHGKGIGYKAMQAILQIAFEKLNKDKIELFCFEENRAAFKIYSTLGFRVIKRILTSEDKYELHMLLTKEKYKNLEGRIEK